VHAVEFAVGVGQLGDQIGFHGQGLSFQVSSEVHEILFEEKVFLSEALL
jgi:hypothetical protein